MNHALRTALLLASALLSLKGPVFAQQEAQPPSLHEPAGATAAPGEASPPASKPPRKDSYTLYLEAHRLFGSRSGQAEPLYRAALALMPNHFLSRLELGQLLLEHNPKEAVEHLRVARRLNPHLDTLHLLLGQALERTGSYLEAAESYRQAIRLNPRLVEANTRLRAVLRRLRARQSTVDRAAESFLANPNLATLTLFGRMVMKETSPRQALLEFEEIRTRTPGLVEVWLWIARAEHALGNSDGEIQAYRSYLEVHPGALGVGLMLLQRLQENGYYREAADYAATLQLDTLSEDSHAAEDRARAWYLESRVASAMDQPVQAALDLRKALRLGYDARQMAQAFAEDLSLYPDTGTLWLVHAEWLEHESPQRRVTGPKLQSYVDSLRQAGLLDPAIRPEARLRLEALLTHPGSAPPAHLALGELALADSDRTEALSQLERVPAGHGLDSAASLLRGQIYRDAGDIAGSVDAFLRYVMAQPNPGEMRFARGNVLWVLGQRSAALALWETDPQALRSHPEALSSLAGHYQTRQEPAMEIQTRQRLALLQPANHRNLIRLGEVLHGQGRTREAVNYWETALKQRPRDHQLLESLGRAYLTLGDQERGVNRLFQVTRMRPLDESSNALLADSLMRRGELGDALRVFSDILRSNPTHAGARKAIPELVLNVPSDDALRRSAAEIALGDGRMELAGELYSVLLRDHPEEEPLRMTLVDVRMRQGQLAEVERLLLEGIDEGSPRTQERLEMLADLQQRQERPAALAETLVRLRRLRPGDADLARRLGLLLVSLKRGTEAKPVLEASLSTQGGNPEVRLHLARLSLAAKDEPGTVTHFTALLAVQPDQPEALAWLIPHHLKAKEWAAALPLLNRQAELTPQDPVVRYNLVVSLLNLNRTGESRPHYDFLRGLDPVRADRLKGYFP